MGVDPVVKLTGSFHLPPYNAEEQAAIGEAKVAADKSGEQTRADLVFPNLMIGNMYAAEDAQYLASQGVTHLLNTAGLQTEPDCVRPNLEELEVRGIKVLTLPINDRAFVGIKEHFPTSGAWIREALQGGGKVLVNCFQGASRSATIVLAYMVDPVVKLTGSFHLPPYNAEEQAAIGEAKVAADKSGEQTRADLVFPNLMIGNMYAAEDAQYLASQGVTHLLNTAGLQTEPDCVRPNLEE